MSDKLPQIQLEEGEATPQTLLIKALRVSLDEHSKHFPDEMVEVTRILGYIRFNIEAAFIKDESQLLNIYNKLRDGAGTVGMNASDVGIRFIMNVMNRWFSYIMDELGLDITDFIVVQAANLTRLLTCMCEASDLLEDVIGQTLSSESWNEWLTKVPLLLVVFNLKYIDYVYMEQLAEFHVKHDYQSSIVTHTVAGDNE